MEQNVRAAVTNIGNKRLIWSYLKFSMLQRTSSEVTQVRNNILRNDPSRFGYLYFENKTKKNTFLCFHVKQTSQRLAILWGLNTKFLILSSRSTLKNVHIAWFELHFNSFILIYFQTAKKRGFFYATRENISTLNKLNLKCKCEMRNNLSLACHEMKNSFVFYFVISSVWLKKGHFAFLDVRLCAHTVK